MEKAWIYIPECADGSYYTGKTENLERRLTEHQNGVFKGYTSSRLPVKLIYSQVFSTYLEAINAERQIKGWSRAKKQALIRWDFELLHHLAEYKNETYFKNRK
ncbi:GIY-YIG nuclease family protein [candidate division KSB1 bacterium]|nr:GIY-YIG nuclease family protein [candidate division KSB1 bacterium]